jgi:hypothetical protein
MSTVVRLATAAASLALAAGVAVAQQPAPPAAANTATVRGPRIAVEPTVFDFGKAQQEKTLEKAFTVRNLGTEELVIENVSTTCGCTVVSEYAKVLKPGASTSMRVKLETRNNLGKISRSVLIKSNDPSGRPLELKVEATVERPPAS